LTKATVTEYNEIEPRNSISGIELHWFYHFKLGHKMHIVKSVFKQNIKWQTKAYRNKKNNCIKNFFMQTN